MSQASATLVPPDVTTDLNVTELNPHDLNPHDLDPYVEGFKRDGYAIFPGVFTEGQRQSMIELHGQLARRSAATGKPNFWFGGVFEESPETFLPAVSHPVLLDFAERVMGPFVQLDNLSLVGFPSVDPVAAVGKVSGWHRDRWAKIPAGVYERPLAINAISYFQDLDEFTGPLRVIPGSHREPITLEERERALPHPQERIVFLKAGDVVFIHNALLHSGTPNISGRTRFFFSLYYNLTWLHSTDSHNGPATQAILARARENRDFRTQRLFGADEQMPARANSGFVRSDEELWAQWCAADRAALVPNGA